MVAGAKFSFYTDYVIHVGSVSINCRGAKIKYKPKI